MERRRVQHQTYGPNSIQSTAMDVGTIWTTERVYFDNDKEALYSANSRRGSETQNNRVPSVSAPRAYQPYQFAGDNNTHDQQQHALRPPYAASDSLAYTMGNAPSFNQYTLSRLSNKEKKYTCLGFAFAQMISALALFIFSITRFGRAFGSDSGDLLLDFIKVEDHASSNSEGTDIIAMKIGSASFVPCIFQFSAGVCGLYNFYRYPPKFLVIACLFFTMIALFNWFEPIILVAFEINLRYVQLENLITSAPFIIFIILTIIIVLFIVILNSIVIVLSSMLLVSNDESVKHFKLDAQSIVLTTLATFASVILGAVAASKSMTNVTEWSAIALRNHATFYGFGLRELLVMSFAACTVVFAFFILVTKSRKWRFSAFILEILALLLILHHLVNGDRILAISYNVYKMYSVNVRSPFIPLVPLLLYTFVFLATILLAIQIVIASITMFRSRLYHIYDNPYVVPRPRYTPQQQRSAL